MLTPFLVALLPLFQTAPDPSGSGEAAPERSGASGTTGAGGVQVEAVEADALPAEQDPLTLLARASTLEERVARDALLSFSGATARRAREDLALSGLPAGQRASALVALGAAGDQRDLDRLISSALAGEDVERRAAVLALGELGEISLRSLGRVAQRGERALAGVCTLALAMIDTQASRDTLRLLADDPEHPYRSQARAALDGRVVDADGASDLSALSGYEFLLMLRWNGARNYGFVNGRRWDSIVLEAWGSNQLFLERMVLEACVRSGGSEFADREAVRDHLFEIVISPGHPSRLAPAVELLSLELSDLIDAGLWRPADGEEWRVLIDTIEERHLERASVQLLQHAMTRGNMRRRAGPLILRGGGLPNPAWLTAELAAATPDRLATLIDAIAEGGDRERIEDILNRLGPEPPPRLAGRALVSLVRLDHDPSREHLTQAILGPTGQRLTGVLIGLLAAVHDPRLGVHVDQVLTRQDIDAQLRFELELALALQGRPRSREALRTWLNAGGRGENRRLVVRALGAVANESDLEVFRNLFPHETDLELNVELALALLRVRDPLAMGLLEQALWEAPRNVSILAGGVLVGVHGLQALIDQLEVAPPDAREEDFRRVGFAIGEWGGLAAVEIVSRRRSSTDPVVQGAVLGALSTRTR